MNRWLSVQHRSRHKLLPFDREKMKDEGKKWLLIDGRFICSSPDDQTMQSSSVWRRAKELMGSQVLYSLLWTANIASLCYLTFRGATFHEHFYTRSVLIAGYYLNQRQTNTLKKIGDSFFSAISSPKGEEWGGHEFRKEWEYIDNSLLIKKKKKKSTKKMFQLLVSVSLHGAGWSTEPDLRITVAFIPGAWSATGVAQLI